MVNLVQRFLTFFVSFTLKQNQKIDFTPKNVCQGIIFLEKGPGQVLLEKRCKLTLR